MDTNNKQIYKSFEPLGFLATLFEPTYKYLVKEGFTCEDVVIDIVSIDPTGNKPVNSTLISLRDIFEVPTNAVKILQQVIETNKKEERNTYFSLSVHDRRKIEERRKEKPNARSNNETSLGLTNFIAFDFDITDFHKNKSLTIPKKNLNAFLMELIERILSRLSDERLKPSFIVNSGAGIHFYYYFDEAFDYTNAEVAKLYDEIKDFFAEIYEDFAAVEFDSSAVSPFRIFKLPFTKVYGYQYQGQEIILESKLMKPSFGRFMEKSFIKHSLKELSILISFLQESAQQNTQEDNHQWELLKQYWSSKKDVYELNEWALFDTNELKRQEYERYKVSLEDIIRGEKVSLDIKRIAADEPKVKDFLEALKDVWAKILKEFKEKHGISRHFLTVAIHAKLLHYFDIDEQFFIDWYKNVLFPYLVEQGIEDKRDLSDRIQGAIKWNFEKKKRGEPLGVVAFLKSYDNATKNLLHYSSINLVLTNFLKQWAKFKRESVVLETGRIYTFYRLYFVSDKRLVLLKYTVNAIPVRRNVYTVFKEPIRQMYGVNVSEITYTIWTGKEDVVFVKREEVDLLTFALPGMIIERLYLDEESLEKLSKLNLPDNITFEEVMLLCDKYNLFKEMLTKIGLFTYEELDKNATGENESTVKYKEVDFAPYPFYLHFKASKSMKIYNEKIKVILHILNYLASHFKSEKIITVPFWGIINKGLVLLPNNSAVTREVVAQMANHYAGEFNFVVNQFKYEKSEEMRRRIRDILVKLYHYVYDDRISKLILQYSLGSVFAYYLFNQKKISLVPSLVIIGPKSTGKSNRVSLFSENLWLGNTLGGKASLQVLQNTKSSTYRFDAYQFIIAPLHFDELTSFPDELIGIIKDQSTSFGKSASIRGRGSINKGATMTPYVRTYMLSVNHFDLKEDAFADRFIIIDLDDPYYQEALNNINGPEKYQIKLALSNIIFQLGVFILLNANAFFSEIDKIPPARDRSESKSVLISVGGAIAKKLFSIFDLHYEPEIYVDRGSLSAVTEGDKLWELLLSDISNLLSAHNVTSSSWVTVIRYPLSVHQLNNLKGLSEDDIDKIRFSYYHVISALSSKNLYLGFSSKTNSLYLLIDRNAVKRLGTKLGVITLKKWYDALKEASFVREFASDVNTAIIYDKMYPIFAFSETEFERGKQSWFVGVRLDLLNPYIKPVISSLELQMSESKKTGEKSN